MKSKIWIMQRNFTFIIASFIFIGILISCQKILPPAPADDTLLDGTVEGLTGEQNARFLKGDKAFNNDVFTTATGLPPQVLHQASRRRADAYCIARQCGCGRIASTRRARRRY